MRELRGSTHPVGSHRGERPTIARNHPMDTGGDWRLYFGSTWTYPLVRSAVVALEAGNRSVDLGEALHVVLVAGRSRVRSWLPGLDQFASLLPLCRPRGVSLLFRREARSEPSPSEARPVVGRPGRPNKDEEDRTAWPEANPTDITGAEQSAQGQAERRLPGSSVRRPSIFQWRHPTLGRFPDCASQWPRQRSSAAAHRRPVSRRSRACDTRPA